MDGTQPEMQALFNDIARKYDAENRGIPRLFAKHVASLSPAISSDSVVHDNACGPAVVTSELFATGSTIVPSRLEATDISPAMASAASDIAKTHSWDFVKATQMDATKLTFDDNTFSHSFTNMLIPTQPAAVAEIYRTLQPGGTALYTAWQYHGLVDLWKRCSELIFPDPEASERIKTQWPSEAMLRELFQKSGFAAENIEVRVHSEQHPFDGIADLARFIKIHTARMYGGSRRISSKMVLVGKSREDREFVL